MTTLKDRVAVVTGAAGGIGRAIALELAVAGMDVVLADMDERGMQATAGEINALGRRCTVVPTDVRELAQVEQLLPASLIDVVAKYFTRKLLGFLRGEGKPA